MSKTTLKAQHHCVNTKYRHPVINEHVLIQLTELVAERVSAWEGELFEVNGEPDHIHILMELPLKYAVADFVNALKTGTSRRQKRVCRPR